MKKVLLASVILAISGFSAQALDTSAVVITDESCGMLNGGGGFILTTDTKRIATGSPNGNTMFQCRTQLPSHDGGAYNFSFETQNIACGIMTQTGFVATNDWHQVISSDGQATLTCKYNSNK